MKKLNITVLNGPNLNLLGKREPETYGYSSLSDIEKSLNDQIVDNNINLNFIQTNKEYELVDKIQELIHEENHYIILNPAAFTHTSIAIRDALLAVKIPFIEVHLSNVYAREKFRHKSWFSDIAIGTITGLGALGYNFALDYVIKTFQQNKSTNN